MIDYAGPPYVAAPESSSTLVRLPRMRHRSLVVPTSRHGFDSKTLRPVYLPRLRCRFLIMVPIRAQHGAGYSSWLRFEDPEARLTSRVCGAAPCTSRLFMQAGESVPCTSRLFLQAAVHFARLFARTQFRARKAGKCTSNCPSNSLFGVHFRRFTAGSRALRLISCTSSH